MIDNAVELLNVVIAGATFEQPAPLKRKTVKARVESTPEPEEEEEQVAAATKHVRGRPKNVPNPTAVLMGILEANPDTEYNVDTMDAALRAKGIPVPRKQIKKTFDNMRKSGKVKVKYGRGQSGRAGKPLQEYKLAA